MVRSVRRPRPVLIAVSASILLLAVACGGDSDSSNTSAAGASQSSAPGDVGCADARGKVVGYSEPLPDPNFQSIEKIIGNVLGKYGAELRPVNANLDPGKQIADIQSLVQARVAALVVNPVDPNATKPALDRARAAKIPIIAQETTIGGPYFTNVSADVEAAATQGAELLGQTLGKGAKVAAVNGPAFAEVIVRENKAFAAAAKDAGLQLVETAVNQKITPQDAKAFADSWKQKYGADLKGVWTFNDTSAVGVASSTGGTFTPKIVSINGQPEAIPLVKDGRILATWDIQQDKLGQALAYASLAAICGKQVPAEIVIPVKKIDKSNVDSWRPLTDRVNDPFDVQFEKRGGRDYLKG